MSKKNVAYVKPEEPSFLKKLKEQIGYKEGPTVDTKRQNLEPINEADLEDGQDEQPTIVVLNSGDLTAEEAEQARRQLEKEEEETPADLNTRVIFKPPEKSKGGKVSDKGIKRSTPDSDKNKNSKKLKSKPLLSFDEEELDD